MFRSVTLCLLFLLFALLQTNLPAFAQTTSLPVTEWSKKLFDRTDKENKWFYQLNPVLDKLDSSTVFNFLNQLGTGAETKGNYFFARFNCIKANMLYLKNQPGYPTANNFINEQVKKQIINLLEEAKQKSYESNDDYLTAFVSEIYGQFMRQFGETEAAVMYLMNCAELHEKVHVPANFIIYEALGEMLWRVREYEKCIKYTRKAIELLPAMADKEKYMFTKFCDNTMALAFHRMEQYDSAFIYYKRGLDFVEKVNDTLWRGIISGNMGQIYFAKEKYTTALPLFEMDYKTSNARGFYDNAANSLQWAARTNLALGKTGIALQQVREAFRLLQKWPARNYQQNAYFTAAEIFKALKTEDSSFYYSGLYNKLHDSLEKEIYQSSVSISKLRLNDEKNRYNILNLQREKQAEIQRRNLIISGILFLTAVTVFVINRQRLKSKYRRQLAEQEKLRVEQEMEAARAELKMFTQNIVEKTNLIEQLERQLQTNYNTQQEALIKEITNQTILTEEDWLKFKILFEKIHPGFFAQLRQRINDITIAEQRMAALIRLQLQPKQISSLLGISLNSVYKTKQRLRQRFNLQTDWHVEEFLAGL